MFFCHIVFILYILFCLTEQIVNSQTVSSEKIDVESILRAFCRQKHRLDVMECVNDSTQGQALEPWNDCLNPDKELNKKEVTDLACMVLHPEFKPVLNVLSECVKEFVSYSEAEAWMSILKSCAFKTDTTADIETPFGNTVRSA